MNATTQHEILTAIDDRLKRSRAEIFDALRNSNKAGESHFSAWLSNNFRRGEEVEDTIERYIDAAIRPALQAIEQINQARKEFTTVTQEKRSV